MCYDLVYCAGLGRNTDRRHGRHRRPGPRRDLVKVDKSRIGTCVSKPLRARQARSDRAASRRNCWVTPKLLLDFDFGADILELLLDGGRLVLVHAFLDWLGRAI